MEQHLTATQGVPCPGVVADEIAIAAGERRKARIEALGRHVDASERHVLGQQAAHAAGQGRQLDDVLVPIDIDRIDIDVSHLAACVHARVRAARAGHLRSLREPERARQGVLHDALDRAESWLPRPAGEVSPVVGEVQPKPSHHPSYGNRIA